MAVDQPEQTDHSNLITLTQENTLGQSFVARFDGLNGIRIYFEPEVSGTGDIVYFLYTDPTEKNEAIAHSSLPLHEINTRGYYDIKFHPQEKSTNQYYFISFKITGNGSALVSTGGGNTYINGSLYKNDLPEDAQLAFKLRYDPTLLILGLLREGLNWLILLFISLWLYILPGWALLHLLLPKMNKIHLSIKIGLSTGVSLASYPILFLLTDLVGLSLGYIYALLLPLFGLCVLSWSIFQQVRGSLIKGVNFSDWFRKFFYGIKPESILLSDLALSVCVLLIIFTRFWTIRNIDLPMWGDSYQHSMIVQLLLDHEGLFQSWSPYTSLDTFTYHFGFHANAAVFSWFTDKTAVEAVLWTGQIINILAVLTLLPVINKISNNPWAGVCTVLIAGLLTDMPAYYVNWGRYTQLTGQAILLTGVFFIWELFEKIHLDWKLLTLNWLVLGGLALTHYRVVIFGILFLPAFWIINLRKNNWYSIIRNSLLYGLGSGILFLPWLFRISAGKIPAILKNQLTSFPTDFGTQTQSLISLGRLDQYLPMIIWYALILCFAWVIWKKNYGSLIIGLWWLIIFIFANPGLFRLPGNGVISNFAVFIAAYIPSSLIIPGAITDFLQREEIRSHTEVANLGRSVRGELRNMIAIFIVIVLSIMGTLHQKEIADPDIFALASRPDLRAAEWIETNLPEDARFLINSFVAYKGVEAVGSDGGWWLPLLAHRQTSITPLTSGFEKEAINQEHEEIEIIKAIEKNGLDDPIVLDILADQGLTHVYLGQQQGSVNSENPLLDVEILSQSQNFREIYHQDRVWIFEINYHDR